jgi:hypothetical protein
MSEDSIPRHSTRNVLSDRAAGPRFHTGPGSSTRVAGPAGRGSPDSRIVTESVRVPAAGEKGALAFRPRPYIQKVSRYFTRSYSPRSLRLTAPASTQRLMPANTNLRMGYRKG